MGSRLAFLHELQMPTFANETAVTQMHIRKEGEGQLVYVRCQSCMRTLGHLLCNAANASTKQVTYIDTVAV